MRPGAAASARLRANMAAMIARLTTARVNAPPPGAPIAKEKAVSAARKTAMRASTGRRFLNADVPIGFRASGDPVEERGRERQEDRDAHDVLEGGLERAGGHRGVEAELLGEHRRGGADESRDVDREQHRDADD